MTGHDLVAVGGSAGSLSVLRTIIPALPADLPAAVLVTMHLSATGGGAIVEQLDAVSALRVVVAVDGQPIEPGSVYVAPGDHHLLAMQGVIRLGRGPRENMVRPAIDPMFRSAALSYGSRAIGVVLSGHLNDGASGLFAIKQRGGLAVVQQPLDAEVPSMPQAALEAVDPDRVVRAANLAAALCDLVRQPAAPGPAAVPDLELEVRIALGDRLGSSNLGAIAQPSALSCPHCHGVLSEIVARGPLRYRCQTGHAFTAEAALAGQQAEVDEAMMIALRVMEERVTLVSRMGREAREQGRAAAAELYEARAEEYGRYAATLREAAVRAIAPGPSYED